MSEKPVCAVVGVGPGNGEAYARRFSQGGYRVALLARSPDFIDPLAEDLDDALAVRCDATDPASMRAAMEEVGVKLGPVGVLLYNAGSGTFKTAEDTTAEEFEAAWRVNVLGLAEAVRAVLPGMRGHGCGAVVVTGASAAWRGRAGTAAFASAKAAQRSLAQSLARQLGPEEIHVAYLVIDGVVDLPRTRKMMPDKPDSFFLDPAAVAEAAWTLAHQGRSAWSFEMDVRPFGETW